MSETQFIEYKLSFTDAVIESIVAFVNANGGKILVGVDDTGNPSKQFTIEKESISKWITDIKLKTQPSVIFDIEEIVYKGQTIIEIRV